VEFVTIPIGHAGTTLLMTLDHLTTAFSTVCPRVVNANAKRGTPHPVTDSSARSHDYHLFKSILDALTDLAQPRHLGIIGKRERLVAVSRHRANSGSNPSNTQVATQQGAATHKHRTRNTRIPESTAIT
jgi:hypothetical protein